MSIDSKFIGINPPVVTQLIFPKRNTKAGLIRHYILTENGQEKYAKGVPLEEMKLAEDYQLFIYKPKIDKYKRERSHPFNRLYLSKKI